MGSEEALVRDEGGDVIDVGRQYLWDGAAIYARVEPAGSRWLPLRGRTSRWWYEVHIDLEDGTSETLAYEDGMSGGGFTLLACVRRALGAIEAAWIARAVEA